MQGLLAGMAAKGMLDGAPAVFGRFLRSLPGNKQEDHFLPLGSNVSIPQGMKTPKDAIFKSLSTINTFYTYGPRVFARFNRLRNTCTESAEGKAKDLNGSCIVPIPNAVAIQV
jgi:hypothetical protein